MRYDHRFYVRHWLGRVAALVCLAGVGLNAQAGITLSRFAPNPGVLPGGGFKFSEGTTFGNPTPPRAWVDGNYGSVPAVRATDSVKAAGPAGPLTISVDQKVALGDAAVTIASMLVPEVAGPLRAAQVLYHAYRIFKDDGAPAGELRHDPGQPSTSYEEDQFCVDLGSGAIGCAISAQAAFDTAAGRWNSSPAANGQFPFAKSYGGTCVVSGDFCTGATFTIKDVRDGSVQVSTTVDAPLSRRKDTGSRCPASLDALNPGQSIPAGGPVGADGMCPTARYNHEKVNPAQAAAILANNPSTVDPSSLTAGLKDAIESGGTAPAEITTSGPASMTGQPTTSTTTNPDGSSTTTTDTPTYGFSYNGDTVGYSTTHNVVTNTCTGAGSCSTTTTTTTTPGPVAGGAGGTPTPPTEECPAGSTKLACISLGDPPTDVPPTASHSISFAAEALSLPESCPAAVTVPNVGVVSYDQMCDAAVRIRPFMIFGAVVTALGLVLAAVRTM